MYKIYKDREFIGEYEYLIDFVRDEICDEDVIEYMNEIFDSIDIPMVGPVPAGKIIYKILSGGDRWDDVVEGYLQDEVDYIDDTINISEDYSASYRGFFIKYE